MQAEIPPAAFYLPDVAPVQPALVRQLLLAEAELGPAGAHPLTKRLGCIRDGLVRHD